MISKDIFALVEENKIDSKLSNESLCNIIMYKIGNSPYFKDRFDFLNLYIDKDSEIKFGNMETNSLSEHYYSINDSSGKFRDDFNGRKNLNCLLKEDEKRVLNNLYDRFQTLKDIKELENLKLKEIAILGKVNDNALFYERGHILKVIMSSKENGVVFDQKHEFNDGKFKEGSISKCNFLYGAFLEKLLEDEIYNYNKERQDLESRVLKTRGLIDIALVNDGLEHLKYSNDFSTIEGLSVFKHQKMKNTDLSILLDQEINTSEKAIKLFNKYELKNFIEEQCRIIEKFLQNENTIEDLLTENKEIIEPILEKLYKKYPTLKSVETKITNKEVWGVEDLEDIKYIDIDYFIRNKVKSVKNKFNFLQSITEDFEISKVFLNTRFFEDSIYQNYRNNDAVKNNVFIYKNDIEILGVISAYKNEDSLFNIISSVNFQLDNINDEQIKNSIKDSIDFFINKKECVCIDLDDFKQTYQTNRLDKIVEDIRQEYIDKSVYIGLYDSMNYEKTTFLNKELEKNNFNFEDAMKIQIKMEKLSKVIFQNGVESIDSFKEYKAIINEAIENYKQKYKSTTKLKAQ